jgi:hypothetical protein
MPFLNDARKSGIGMMVLSGMFGALAFDVNHFSIQLPFGLIFLLGIGFLCGLIQFLTGE